MPVTCKCGQVWFRTAVACLSILGSAVCTCILVLEASCLPGRPGVEQSATAVPGAEKLTIFLTGHELSALKPCGCSGGQLGGLDRRWAVLNSIPKQTRLIVDTGSFVKTDSDQDLIKFRIVVEAFKLLNYDVINLTDNDIRIATNLSLLDEISSAFSAISVSGNGNLHLPAQTAKKFSLADGIVVVTIAAFDGDANQMGGLSNLFPVHPGAQAVNILVVNKSSQVFLSAIAENAPSIDCVICPSDYDEPLALGETGKAPIVFSVGRFGRYVCKLEVSIQPTAKPDPTAIAYCTRLGHTISLFAVPVAENLPKAEPLVDLYKRYQELVKEGNFLEKYLRLPLPDDKEEYLGSYSCKACHEYEFEKWSAEPHTKAYATLEKIGSQYDPECVVCHVVGMDYKTGFVTVEKTAHLKDVGCESCHGPSAEHIRTCGKIKTGQPKSACLYCHTPERSPTYVGNEKVFLEKIVHWKEPNAVGNVKK